MITKASQLLYIGFTTAQVDVPLLSLSTALCSSVVTVTVVSSAPSWVMYIMNNDTTHKDLGGIASNW